MTESTDFFVAGGTLRATDPSYVTRPADHDLLQQLQAGEFCYVLTPRQMGKSSLMVRTAQRLRADGTHVAIVDLTSIGGGSSELSADQWYLGLLSRVRVQLRLATDVELWWDEHAALGIAQRFITFLHEVLLAECTEPVVILIDEIDSTLNLNFRDDFFAAIRALYNERATDPIYQRLTFALFGVATPTDLIQDRERTPFNIGQRIDLREFTLDDAQPLRDGLAASFSAQADALLHQIFAWTNGHPYLTQKLCQVLQTEAPTDLENDVAGYVDEAVQHTFFSEEGRKDPNLTFVQDRIANSPDNEKRRMLQLYNRVQRGDDVADDDRSPVQNRLELYGLVGVAQGQLQVRNRIYAQVFDGAWVGSMMPVDRRQRRAALAGVGALVLVIGVGIWLFMRPATECSVFSEQFNDNEDSGIRLSALASLFNQGNHCRDIALDLFYGLQPEEQKALFLGLDNFPSERDRLVTIIDPIFRTLDTIPEHDVDLMKDWDKALEWAEIESDNQLHVSLKYWQEGRTYAYNGEHRAAALRYQDALDNTSDGNHPALRYDMALAYIELEEYDKALIQLNALLRIADTMPVTPTPTVSPTPSESPTQVATNTPAEIPFSQTDTMTPINVTSIAQVLTETTVLATATVVPEHSMTNERFISTAVSKTIIPAKEQIQYRQRFRNADTIRNTARSIIEENPMLLRYYQENTEDYRYLVSLGIATLPIAVVPTFTSTPTLVEFTSIVTTSTTMRTQSTPLPILTAAETLTLLPSFEQDPSSFIYRIQSGDCVFEPHTRQQTGFRVQDVDGIVTALHGVADCKTLSAVSDDEETVLVNLVIRAVDIDRDIALLWSPDFDDMPTGGLLVTDLSRDAIIDASLHIIGYPLGLEKQYSDNIESVRAIESLDAVIPDSEEPIAFVKRKSPDLDIDVLNLQANLLPGHTGAPILDDKNSLVGVGSGGLRSGTVNRSWAVPWSDVNLQSVDVLDVQSRLAVLSGNDPQQALAFSSTYPSSTQFASAQITPTAMPAVRPLSSLQVLDEGSSAHTYLLEGDDVRRFNVGDDLVVYGEPNPGIEVAIAALKVIGKSDNALIAQALLIDPTSEIRAKMRVDDQLSHLSESRLIPVFDYAVGYLLSEARVRLRPSHQIEVGARLQALEPERINEEIIDALPSGTELQVTGLGIDGQVAVVALLAGSWPVTGTIVSLVPNTMPTPTAPADCSFAILVLDEITGEGIRSATVSVIVGTYQDTGVTDSDGYYRSRVPCQESDGVEARVRVFADSYESHTSTVYLADQTKEIYLNPVGVPTSTVTPTPRATATPTPPIGTPSQAQPRLEIIKPQWGDTMSGPSEIRWRYSGQIGPNQGFDLMLWYEDNPVHRGIVDVSKIMQNLQEYGNGEYGVTINVSSAPLVQQYCDASYLLYVVVVDLNPYERTGIESDMVDVRIRPIGGGCG